ncbi:MAG: hypothetical protein QOK02_4410, partial [Mycobacterium sp.]|nr:hypothetical protein [Mycobacterium sp.]
DLSQCPPGQIVQHTGLEALARGRHIDAAATGALPFIDAVAAAGTAMS